MHAQPAKHRAMPSYDRWWASNMTRICTLMSWQGVVRRYVSHYLSRRRRSKRCLLFRYYDKAP